MYKLQWSKLEYYTGEYIEINAAGVNSVNRIIKILIHFKWFVIEVKLINFLALFVL